MLRMATRCRCNKLEKTTRMRPKQHVTLVRLRRRKGEIILLPAEWRYCHLLWSCECDLLHLHNSQPAFPLYTITKWPMLKYHTVKKWNLVLFLTSTLEALLNFFITVNVALRRTV
jgi:hypothetical protein